MTLLRYARVFTPLGDDVLLFFSMDGTESMGQPFEYEVDLLSTDEQLDLTQLLGQPILITLELPNTQIREFSGYVTRFVLVGSVGRYVRYRATLRPWVWLITRRSNCRIFQNQTVPEVVLAMFREHGFSDFKDLLSGSYRTWEYLVQYRESDFNFISRIMEQEGIYYYFTHAEGKHTLVLSDSYSAHQPAPGYEVIPYVARSRDHVMDDHIDSWRAIRQITSGAFTAADYDFEAPKAKLGSTLAPGAAYPGGEYELYDYPGEFADNKQADEQVKVRLQAELAQHDVVRGEGNARGIHAGALMTLSDFPRVDQNKEYLITSTSISIRSEGYESLIDATADPEAPSFRVSFSAIDAKRNFRVPRTTPKPVVRGPQSAVVVGQGGQEIWTDEYGRVKVQFYWDREGTFDENSSCWVRVAQLWAGSGWGGIHIPRIGQEVIVDFLEGNPDRPVITGRLYNADNMPPYELPANQTQSGIKSHSTKGGGQDNFNEIKFEDKKGEEELSIQAEKDMTTLVKNNQNTTVKGSISVTIGEPEKPSSPDRTSTMNVKGKHSVDASDTMSMQAPNSVTLTCGGSSITLTPDRIVLKAGGGTEIAMDANGKFESSQGSKLFLDANAKLESSGGSSVLFDANAYVEASGGANVLFDANVNMLSAAGDQVLMDGSVKISGVASVEVSSPKIVCTGEAEASITVGGQSVKLTPASADIGGAMVNVQGQSLVSIKATSIMVG